MFQVHSELPPELWRPVASTMQAVLNDIEPIEILSAAAGYVYTRKAEQSVDLFGRPRNLAYGSDSDDVVLSLTVRIRPTHRTRNLQVLANNHEDRELDCKIKDARAELERLTAQALQRDS